MQEERTCAIEHSSDIARSSTTDVETMLNTFVFEADDTKSLIINYSGLEQLKQHMGYEDIVKHLVQSAQKHMDDHKTPQFIFHLFCNGMLMKDMMQHRKFMMSLAVMFRDTFPTQLYACYVHHAPSFFHSVYDMLHNIIPKSARDKIIMVKSNKKLQSQEK